MSLAVPPFAPSAQSDTQASPLDDATARDLVDRLVNLLRVQPVGEDRFVGQSEDIGTPAVFGGQVLGQALMAACGTVGAERPVHSMHAYFLLPGEHAPIEYEVLRARDGRSFSTRHVVARQRGLEIFEMTASFQLASDGADHQDAAPQVEQPEALVSELEHRRAVAERLPPGFGARWREKSVLPRALEYRHVQPYDLLDPVAAPPQASMWLRAVAPLPEDFSLHCAMLAYASDHGLLLTAMRPHGLALLRGDVRLASLDHAMWFHRDLRIDDWLLHDMDSPSACGARALCRGRVFDHQGRLVASTAQEGMMRLQRPGG